MGRKIGNTINNDRVYAQLYESQRKELEQFCIKHNETMSSFIRRAVARELIRRKNEHSEKMAQL